MTGIGIIGDSLTYQAGQGANRITGAFRDAGIDTGNLGIDGYTGRGLAGPPGESPIDVIRRWRHTGFDSDVWLIALGTNNKNATADTWRKGISRILGEIGPGRDVHWVGLGFRDPGDSRVECFNSVLEVMAYEGSQFTAHDWDEYIHDGRDETGLWLASDPNGVHMTTEGYDIRNKFYAQCITGETT